LAERWDLGVALGRRGVEAGVVTVVVALPPTFFFFQLYKRPSTALAVHSVSRNGLVERSEWVRCGRERTDAGGLDAVREFVAEGFGKWDIAFFEDAL
jgi:hypothetical protein